MKLKWFEKDLKKALKSLGDTRNIIEDLKDTQQSKIENYPEKFIDTPNYQLSEERMRNLEEIESMLEEVESLLDNFR